MGLPAGFLAHSVTLAFKLLGMGNKIRSRRQRQLGNSIGKDIDR